MATADMNLIITDKILDALFSAFDSDQKGQIDLESIKVTLKKMGLEITTDELY